MKFFKQYREYMQVQRNRGLPAVEFKKLKQILKKCRSELESHYEPVHFDDDNTSNSNFPHQCAACDGTFFPSLLKEMSAVIDCFNDRARELLDFHLATGLWRCFLFVKGMIQNDQISLIQKCQDLVTYAMVNAIAVRKILKKYDKIHYTKQGQAFKSQAQSMHIEILQSPWLYELIAFHINLREENEKEGKGAMIFRGSSLTISDGKPALTCELFDSMKVDIDLKCPICLDTVFDVVALTCGHIFCYMCACSAASVTIVDGLKAAAPEEMCPLCREAAVYEGFVHLEEINILLSQRCHDYWEARLESERVERLQQAKEHWEKQCRAFMGI